MKQTLREWVVIEKLRLGACSTKWGSLVKHKKEAQI